MGFPGGSEGKENPYYPAVTSHFHFPSLRIYLFWKFLILYVGLPRWLSGKESACNAGDLSSVLELGRSPGEENGNPLQYSCLGNLMERGSWQATVHRVTKNWTQLSMRSSEQHGH